MAPTFKSLALAGITLAAVIILLLVAVGIVSTLTWAGRSDPVTGITDTTVENLTFWGAQYLAGPCGLLALIAGIFARRKNLWPKALANTAIVSGVVGVLLAVLVWVLFWLILAFEF